LKKQQTILYEAQKISQTGSCEWDLETGEVKFSSQVYDILGIKKGLEINHIKDLTDRIHPDDYQNAKELTRKGIETQSQLVFEYRIITPDGQIKNIEARGCPLVLKNGRVTSALITLQDITESVNFDKKLITAVVQSEENERARMAGELHDGVCQYLAGTKLMLNTVEKSLTSGMEEPDKQAVVEMIRYSKTSVSDALELTRQISHNLLPVSFHEKGVIQSVKEMTIRLNLAGNIQYKIVTKGKDKGLDPNVSMNIFRIIQEFIRNSQKYSEATEVNIFISINKKEVELEIRDNGIGFDLESVNKKKGVGLLSMRKRIKAIGGSFTYTTSPGNGVHLKLKMTVE
jgi:signal transduction histidine kinase